MEGREGQREEGQRDRLGGAGDGNIRWPGVEAGGSKVPFFSAPEEWAPNTQSLGQVECKMEPWASRKPGGEGGGEYEVLGE